MLTAWILHSLVVTTLAAIASRMSEDALGDLGLPTRWSWFTGMAVAASLFVLPLLPALSGAGLVGFLTNASTLGELQIVPGSGVTIGSVSIPGSIAVTSDSALAQFDPWVAGAWLIGVLGLLAGLARLLARLVRRSRSWIPAEMAEGPVLVSRRTGPALFGVLRTRIVVPGWCLELPAESRRLILDHEHEHRRAGDPLLVAMTGLLALALPWNLPLWWMWSRLRGAVEVDCDARVTRARPEVRRAYGDLLLLVGGRQGGFSPLATFSRHPSTLGRRIHMLTRSATSRSLPRGLFLAALALTFLALACVVPDPGDPGGVTEPESRAAQSGDPAPALEELMERPHFTPRDEEPQVVNPSEVSRSLQDEYPPAMRDNGIGGTVLMYFFIDANGTVRNVEVAESSGAEVLDQAALRVSEVFEFSPGRNQGESVPVWIQVPVAFKAR